MVVDDFSGEAGLLICVGGGFGATKPGGRMLDLLPVPLGGGIASVVGFEGVSCTTLLRNDATLVGDLMAGVLDGGGMLVGTVLDVGSLENRGIPVVLAGLTGILDSSMTTSGLSTQQSFGWFGKEVDDSCRLTFWDDVLQMQTRSGRR